MADAANNSVIHVTRSGKVTLVARVKTRVVEMPEGFDDPQLPPPGTPMPTEAVVTSVAVGPDGEVYLGELRGFPGTPGTSQIWRVEPGATGAVCKPNKPNKGACTLEADGLTSIVALDTGRGGALYVAELSKMGWLAAEFDVPGAEVGAIIRLGHDRNVRRELSPGKAILPGGVAVGTRRQRLHERPGLRPRLGEEGRLGTVCTRTARTTSAVVRAVLVRAAPGRPRGSGRDVSPGAGAARPRAGRRRR